MATLFCASCSNAISSDDRGRFPPWCSRCGADFKPESGRVPTFAAAQPAAGQQQAPVPIPTPATAAPAGLAGLPKSSVPYFNAMVPSVWSSEDRHIFRVYVTKTDLLFLKVTADTDGREKAAAVGSIFGGILGAMVVNAVAGAPSAGPLHDRERLLDVADETTLRTLAADGNGS